MNRGFDRANLNDLSLEHRTAHRGTGAIGYHRVISHIDVDSSLNFADFAVLPPGVSIGLHRHAPDEEEFYLILSGSGMMRRNGETFRVRTGDVIRNPPSGEHSIANDGSVPLRLFVFEVSVP